MRRSIFLLLTCIAGRHALGAACDVPMDSDGEAMSCTDALGCVEVAADEPVTIALP